MRKGLILFSILAVAVCLFAACNAATFSVTFDAQNGELPVTVSYDADFALPQTPVRNGYVFAGWYTDAECSDGNEWRAPQSLSADVTVYARWEKASAKEIYVTFDSQNGEAPITVEFTDNFSMPADPQKQGYTFDGWYKDAACTYGNEWELSETLTENITVYAKWAEFDLRSLLLQYRDPDRNYQISCTEETRYSNGAKDSHTEVFMFFGSIWSVQFVQNGSAFCNFVKEENDAFLFYIDDGSGNYSVADAAVADYGNLVSSFCYLNTAALADFDFTFDGEMFAAADSRSAAKAVLSKDGCSSFRITAENGRISAITAVCNIDGETTVMHLSFERYGEIDISLPDADVDLCKNGHTYGEWNTITAATCISEGIRERTCGICGYKDVRITARIPHNFSNGFCTVCGKAEASSSEDPCKNGHVYGQWTVTVAATCLSEGTETRVCSVCGSMQTQTTAKIDHVYVNGVCSVCGASESGQSADLAAVFGKYSDYEKWNFSVTYVMTDSSGQYFYDDVLRFDGENFSMQYVGTDGVTYTDVIAYDSEKAQYAYYLDNGDGTYSRYYSSDDSSQFEALYSYVDYIELSGLPNIDFSANGDCFSASDPSAAGDEILGQWTDSVWTSVDIYISDGLISRIVAVQNDTSADYAGTYTLVLEFGDYGRITVGAPSSSDNQGGDDDDGEGVSLGWNGNSTSVGSAVGLQKQMINRQYSIGLPSIGSYDCLVVPVKFSDTKVTAEDLSNLNTAFNGTSEETGWESVRSYYQKSSFGKLDLSFDILGYNIGIQNRPYVSSKSYSYYGNLKDSYGNANGDQTLLREILEYLAQQSIDLSHYDSNGDGVIDAIYIIYSCDVNYSSSDSLWWAFVYEYSDYKSTYQSLYADYYLFAGMDFMKEDVHGGYVYNGEIDGLKINAATYIHETAHLLGLDDYYDYYVGTGSDRGLGGADMMDATVGDHNAYSKIMMGWLEPARITGTTKSTLDISDGDLTNDCALISLDNSNSEFGEYLLIDLYSSAGLNEMHAGLQNSLLYGGAAFGARIYHVASSCDNPYGDEYGSFTDNNNSVSDIALIKLIEADGWTSDSSTDNGCWASESDLWQSGGSFSRVYPNYADYGNQPVNFDIFFEEVTAQSATITVTFTN